MNEKKEVFYTKDGVIYYREDIAKKTFAPKKRMQFSQKITLFCAIFSMMMVAAINMANFMLLWNGKPPMEQETVSAINTYGGITSTLTFGGYCALSAIRDCSLNKLKASLNGGEEDTQV